MDRPFKGFAMQKSRSVRSQKIAVGLLTMFLIVAVMPFLSQTASAAGNPSRQKGGSNPLVKMGEYAPDFELPRLVLSTDSDGKPIGVINDKDKVRLSSFRGKKPVCLIMSSYT